MHKKLYVVLTGLFFFAAPGCGKVCDQLESKLCTDLGAEDCKIWKAELGGMDSFRKGRRPDRACGNILLSNYDSILQNYKTAITTMKAAKNKNKKK